MRQWRYFAWLVLVVIACGVYAERFVVTYPELTAQVFQDLRDTFKSR